MPWTFFVPDNSIVTDGNGTFVPVGQPTGLSAMVAQLIAVGAVLPYVAPPVAAAPVPAYSLGQLQAMLIKAGTIPAPTPTLLGK